MNNWILENVSCTVCKSAKYDVFYEKNGFNYVKCSECALVYANPRLTKKEVEKIYNIGFESKKEKKNHELDTSKYNSIIKKFVKYRHNNNILDVGCFNGAFLLSVKNVGWNVFGTELSDKATELAKKTTNGGDVRTGELEDISFPESFFDVVVLLDVIEHLPNPISTLLEIKRILRNGGLLYFDTPNFNSLERIIVGKTIHTVFPWHYYYFTRKTITKALVKSNYSIINCYTEGLGTFSQFDPMRDLSKSKSISYKSKYNIVFQRLKQYQLLLLSVRKVRLSLNIVFRLLSSVGINIGSSLIIFAENKK